MFDVKIVQKKKAIFIAVFYQEKWYIKETISADGTNVPGDEYEELHDEAIKKLLPKLPSLITLITNRDVV